MKSSTLNRAFQAESGRGYKIDLQLRKSCHEGKVTNNIRQTGILILIDQRQILRQLLDDQIHADLGVVISSIREGIRLAFGTESDHLDEFPKGESAEPEPQELFRRLDQLIASSMPLLGGESKHLAEVLDVLNRLRRDIAILAADGSGFGWFDKHAREQLQGAGADLVLDKFNDTLNDIKTRTTGQSYCAHERRRFIDRWITKICQNPQLLMPKEMKDNKMNDEVDLLLITANDHETAAVYDAFKLETGQSAKGIVKSKRTYDDLGTVNGTRVFHTRCEQGSMLPGAAHDTVVKSIEALNPKAIIAIGIAFGAKPGVDKQSIGDILISKQIWLYDPKREGAEKTIYRGSKPDASTRLLSYFRSFHQRNWKGAKVNVGLILSGESLIDNIKRRTELVKREPEAIGGEMEGSGLYVGTHETDVAWIIIKAICDWADGSVNTSAKEPNQKLAAKNAAEFLVQALKNTALKEKAEDNEGSAPGKVATQKPTYALKRSQPDFVLLEKPQIIEFHSGELSNQMVKVDTTLPKLIAFSVERGQWSNYSRAPHLDKDGKIAYSHTGTGSTGGNPINFAVPVIETKEGGKLTALKVHPDAIRDKCIGLAITSEGCFKIERWGQEHPHDFELERVIQRYDLSEQGIESAIDDLGLLESPIDAIVTDEIEDTKVTTALKEKLQVAGLKLYFPNSQKPQ